MKQNKTAEKILSELQGIPVIDTHEHLLPPEFHTSMRYCFFNLMIPYAQFDLVSAGMSPAFMWKNTLDEREEEECYAQFRKYWKYVKHGGYGTHVRRVLRENLGLDDITDDNYKQIGELLNATRTEGHYAQVLREECNIEYILNQAGDYHGYSKEDSYFIPHADMLKNGVVEDVKELLSQKSAPTIEDHIELLHSRMVAGKNYGAKLVKYDASCFLHKEDYREAKRQFEALRRGEETDSEVLQSFVYGKTLAFARELGLVAAVHTGVWDNINRKSPAHLFPVVQANPDIRFDIYHMGMPFTGECAFLGKNFANVSLDLCWSHIVSPQMLVRSMDEWLDLVPYNKIFAFGGDHATLPYNVKTHLNEAKENLALVFAKRVDEGKLDTDEAVSVLKRWFYDNPKEFYGL